MVFLFRDTAISNLFLLLLLCMGVHLHCFFTTVPVWYGNDGIISLLIQKYVVGLSPTLLFILYQAMILIPAIRLNMVLNDQRMFVSGNFTTAMAYVILSGILPEWCGISAVLPANLLLIWLFIKLCRLYNHPSPKTLLFNIGLIVGITVLLYHPTEVLIGVVLFALAVVRPFRIAEWLILLMGILLPYYFLAAWLFLEDNLGVFGQYLPLAHWHLPVSSWNIALIIQLSLLALMILLGLYFWQVSSNRMVIQIRKNWNVMAVMLLLLLTIPFLFRQPGMNAALMCLVPIAAFAGNTFSYPRKLLLPNFIFWLTIAVLVFNNWILLKN
ncbi:MAG TPA: DUF6427 family protein [Sediminibacterium sp.]|nr:DUF6427 family protein [Sediminibacterium sp.]